MRVVQVDIHGQQYAIRSELDPQYIGEIAAYLDEKMRLAARELASSDPLRVAIIAALNIVDELHRAKADTTGVEGRLNGFLEVTGTFEKLGKFFHRHGALRSNLRDALIDLQGFLKVGLLEQCQSQTVESLWVIWHLLQGFAVFHSCLAPLLVPGS